jgi:probable F420-dependent oxidoreductase
MPRPFRFAVTARFAGTGTKWRDVARRAEDLGYDVMLVTDHMGPQLAPIPALMAAADATTRLRVGSFVFANDYRNPVMLAKEVATIDVLSGGRVEVGIGAGWKTGDYRELGIRYDAPAVRVSRLEESVILLKRLLTEEHVDHTGEHYTVRGAQILPRPLQRPHPPLMIGGGGPRVLRLAARQADIVTFAPQVNASGRPRLDTITEKALTERVMRFRAAAGQRRGTDRAQRVRLRRRGDRSRPVPHGRRERVSAARGERTRAQPVRPVRLTRIAARAPARAPRAPGYQLHLGAGNAMREFAPIVAELRGT